MSKAISLADQLKFTRRIKLQEWLKDKPIEWAQVIAVRTALRVLPLVGRVYQSDELSSGEQDRLILSTFHACLISSTASKCPAVDMTADAANIADVADVSDVAHATYAGLPAEALSASSANYAVLAVIGSNVVADAASAIAFAADAAFAFRAALDIWDAVSMDANRLLARAGKEKEQTRLLADTPLWPDGEPEWISKERRDLMRALMDKSEHHLVWINWYLRIIMGKPFFDLSPAREKALTLNIAKQENDFWEQDFAKVSKDISEWLEQARIDDAKDAEQRPLEEEKQKTASVPPIKPATVQPVWVNGRLVQSTAPMHAELQDELLAAFAQVLRNEITALANAAKQANFDKRGLALLAETADLMPDAKPDSVLLFQLIFREAQLSDQVGLINGQWPETLSIRYCTLLRQLREYLDRFSERRQFNRDKLETDLEDIDFDDLDQDVSDFGDYLRSDDVNVIIDVSIPDALDSIGVIAEDQHSIEMPPIATSRSSQVVKAADQVESVNNISRELLDQAGIENAARLGEAGKVAYIQAIEDHYVDASYELGREDAKKAAKLANRGAMGFAAGKLIRYRLSEKYPKFFGWMKRGDD